MNLIFLLGILLIYQIIYVTTAPSTNSTPAPAPKPKPKKWKTGALIFHENFDALNYTIWEPIVTMSGCGTNEFQMYHKYPENLHVKDGILHIQPTLTSDRFGVDLLTSGNLGLEGCTDPSHNGCNKTMSPDHILNPVISARIRSMRSFYFKYGKVEVRAKLPMGDWLFPAIWLNPKYSTYGTWPMSGEIDIVESRGNLHLYDGNGDNVGVEQIQCSAHFGTNRANDRWRFAHATKNLKKGWHSDFHKFQFFWTPEFMTFSVDDEEYLKVLPPKGGFYQLGNFSGDNIWANNWTNPIMAPFDQPFYLILNVAVGGSGGFFSDGFVNSPKPKSWKTGEPMDDAMLKFWKSRDDWYPTWKKGESSFQIDYIKVWSLDTSSGGRSAMFFNFERKWPFKIYFYFWFLLKLISDIF